jgi:hypothetical protein
LIAYINEGVTFKTIAGIVEITGAVHSPTTVNAKSFFSWDIVPEHSLFAADQAQIIIQFPAQYKVLDVCEKPANCEAQPMKNLLLIKNVIADTLQGGDVLKLTVGPIELPHSLGEGSGIFKFTTFMKGVGTTEFFQVDSGTINPMFEMTPGGFKSILLETASDQA